MRPITKLLLCVISLLWLLPGPSCAQEIIKKKVAADDAFVKQFEQQFGPQLRLMLRTELHLMRLVTQPTKEQYEKIAAEGETAFKTMTTRLAVQMRQGQGVGTPDPRTLIADGISAAVQKTLSREQATRYREELDERTAARKRMVVKNLVAGVDRVLLLTTEQRGKLLLILERHWDASWNQPELYMGQYFPMMPDKEMLPILTDAQHAVWRGVTRGNRQFGFNLNIVAVGIDLAEEGWDDLRPPAQPEPAAGEAEQEERLVAAEDLVVVQAGYTEAQFDSWVFQQHRTQVAARQSMVAELAMQVNHIDQSCRLTSEQKQKLQLMGRGDIKRFYDRYETVREKFLRVKHDEEKFQEIWQDISPLQMSVRTGLFHDDSLLYRLLPNVLSEEQFARHELVTRERRSFRHEANLELVVSMLEQAAPLRAAQRRDLLTLLTKATKPPRRSGQYDYYAIMVQIGRLPQEKLRPLFTETQLKVFRPQWERFQQMEPQLKAAGQWPDEGDDADKPAALKK